MDLADMIILLTTYVKNRKRNKLNGLKLSLLTELLDSNWGNFDQKVTWNVLFWQSPNITITKLY